MRPVKKFSYPMNNAIATILMLFIMLFTVAPLSAQQNFQGTQAETLQLQQYRRSRDLSSPAEEELRRQAEWRQSDLVRKANKFAVLWAQFTADVNTGKAFDTKLAKKLQKAFSDLEQAQGWPNQE
jgi:hypothetical protein